MFFVGVFIILIFNAFMYYDQMQHNKDLFEDKKLAFNIAIVLFVLVELLIFSGFYVSVLKIIGLLND